jgi:hypothetical protein
VREWHRRVREFRQTSIEKLWFLPILHERVARAYIVACGISHMRASRFLSGSRKKVIHKS